MGTANALEVLRSDHREVQKMFKQFESASGKEDDRLCREMSTP